MWTVDFGAEIKSEYSFRRMPTTLSLLLIMDSSCGIFGPEAQDVMSSA